MSLETSFAFFIASLISIFVIVNPFSAAPVFLGITKGDSDKKRKYMAKRASVVSAIILIVFSLAGSYILGFFSITVDAFKIAGGVIIISVGWKMIKDKREYLPTVGEEKEATDKEDVSVVPLAIPMLSGPGAITTSIVLASQASGIFDIFSLLIAIIFVCVVSYIVLLNSTTVANYLGETGMRVAERLMGLIVLVVGVQFIINGMTGVVGIWGLI